MSEPSYDINKDSVFYRVITNAKTKKFLKSRGFKDLIYDFLTSQLVQTKPAQLNLNNGDCGVVVMMMRMMVVMMMREQNVVR